MKYLEEKFSVGAPVLKDGKNTHGQTWEEIFGKKPSSPKPKPFLRKSNEV